MYELKNLNLSFIDIRDFHSDAGCEALYFKFDKEKYAIKLYKNLELATSSYNRQKLAASHGIAPKVGKMVMAKTKLYPKLLYGYETQKARWIIRPTDLQIYDKQHLDLFNKLDELGLSGDFGNTNCGIINDKLVFIDFGSHCINKKGFIQVKK